MPAARMLYPCAGKGKNVAGIVVNVTLLMNECLINAYLLHPFVILTPLPGSVSFCIPGADASTSLSTGAPG